VAEIIPFQPTNQQVSAGFVQTDLLRTDAVYALFSSIDDTLVAACVGYRLARALHVPLTIVHFQTVPFPVPLDHPADVSPLETDAFIDRLQEAGVEANVRVFLCREPAQSVVGAFLPRSLIVLAGPHGRWPRRSGSERTRQLLEAAGHSVIFVETKEDFRA
jgi:hypothetical protein